MPHIRIPKIRALSEVARLSSAFQQRYLQRQRVRSVLLILGSAWLVWTFLLGDASVPRLLSLKRENAQLADQVRKLREEQLGLQAEVSALKKEKQTRMVERIARDQYSMIKEGEILVKFYEEGKGQPAERHSR
jgi:cell division protein FtsB